ncbi:hypothetical protein ZEAMMB73_Zm00001d040773 [Zea mays]|uniref:Uncharacterized protein n=1 Tax=Zea mays TaxID=4577 RepID=A0A1D6MSW3_MAIZE|nr:hypothetical protein ZEAMMB73_Zm00001d040773 [Zea mays]
MSRGCSASGGQSSLGYLFGSGEPPKPVVAPAASAPPVEKPSAAKTDATKQVAAGVTSQTNNYHRADGQNTGNFLTVCYFIPSEDLETKKTSIAVIIVVSVLASVLVVTSLFEGFKYWQKKKRERDQARFLKLFEEGDDLEDELGLSNEF